jgi:hypothetical protein
MKSTTSFAVIAAAAAIAIGAVAGPSRAADNRFILTVESGQECKDLFANVGGAKELRWSFKSGAPDTQQDPPYGDPRLIVKVEFSTTSPTAIAKWTSLPLPMPPSTTGLATPVNALLVRLGSSKHVSDETLIVFYPEALLKDQGIELTPMLTSLLTTSSSGSSTKKIKSLSFCYDVPPPELGYAACPFEDLTSVCAPLREGSFFVINNAADFARGGLDANGLAAKPALCVCPTSGSSAAATTPCDPAPGKENSCPGSTPGLDVFNQSKSEEQVGFQGSCTVRTCTSFFGRLICNSTTVNAPVPPC